MRALCCCCCCYHQRGGLRPLLPLLQPKENCLVRMVAGDAHAFRRCLGVGPVISLHAGHVAVRQYNTTRTTFSSSTAAEAPPLSSSSLCGKLRTIRLHNLPRTWMHEEVVQFLHQVAEHAGIEPPPPLPSQEELQEEEEMTSAIPNVTSPFVARLHIPFGRQTGIIYGAPIMELTSDALTNYLLRDLTFDPDDYRCRIYFTEVTGTKTNNNDDTVTNDGRHDEMTLEAEQQQALAMLDLDRYLLAPDLLYDMAKMRQRRLVTRRSRLLLHTFADDDDDEEETLELEDDKEEREMGLEKGKKKGNKARRKPLRCAGDYKELGRGSRHSIPLPLPYVQGRRGT